jgi:hypothetical protein
MTSRERAGSIGVVEVRMSGGAMGMVVGGSGTYSRWIIDRRADPQTVAADIVESNRNHALPAMRLQLDES